MPQAAIDAANAYEALFVPALFAPWAKEVADAAQIRSGQRVLDVACGTGILAREVSARVGRTGRVAGIDASPGMLAVAGRLAPAVEWRKEKAESLSFADRSFDAVVSQFGLMFFADRIRALREMLRVLVPGGRLAVAVWDALDNNPLFAAEVALLQQMAGPPAADALRAPFALGNRQLLTALFTQAGVAAAEVATRQGTARFPDIRTLVEADLRGWLPLCGVVLTEEQIQRILEAAGSALGGHVHGDGPVTFPVSAHIVTARKP
jgi:SAM-dependent methyltransferase